MLNEVRAIKFRSLNPVMYPRPNVVNLLWVEEAHTSPLQYILKRSTFGIFDKSKGCEPFL
jgi:hypothetical protein